MFHFINQNLTRNVIAGPGYSLQEIMHVGDGYELDVVGARSAGMRAVLLNRSGKLPSGDCETIKSLLALLELLD